jgi:hypothetical protein
MPIKEIKKIQSERKEERKYKKMQFKYGKHNLFRYFFANRST